MASVSRLQYARRAERSSTTRSGAVPAAWISAYAIEADGGPVRLVFGVLAFPIGESLYLIAASNSRPSSSNSPRLESNGCNST